MPVLEEPGRLCRFYVQQSRVIDYTAGTFSAFENALSNNNDKLKMF